MLFPWVGLAAMSLVISPVHLVMLPGSRTVCSVLQLMFMSPCNGAVSSLAWDK